MMLFIFCFQWVAFGKTWTMPELQQRAVEHSALIRAHAQQSTGEAQKAHQTGLLPNPTTYLQFGSLSTSPHLGHTIDATFNQLIPFPGKLHHQEVAQRFLAEIATASESEAKLMVQHGVTLAAIQRSIFIEISKHSQERQRRFDLIIQYLRTHALASPTQKMEAALIENQIRFLERDMLEIKEQAKLADLELRNYLYLEDPQEEIEFVLQLNLPPLPDAGSNLGKLFDHNLIWKKKDLEVQRAVALHTRAKLDPFPDFLLGFNYRIETMQPSNIFFSGAIGLTLPIFDRGQYGIPAAQAKLDTEITRQLYLRKELENSFHQAFAQLETAYRVVLAFPEAMVPEAEKKFEEAEIEFRKDRVSATLFLQIDAQIHETIDTVYQAQFKYLERLSRFLLLVGEGMGPC